MPAGKASHSRSALDNGLPFFLQVQIRRTHEDLIPALRIQGCSSHEALKSDLGARTTRWGRADGSRARGTSRVDSRRRISVMGDAAPGTSCAEAGRSLCPPARSLASTVTAATSTTTSVLCSLSSRHRWPRAGRRQRSGVQPDRPPGPASVRHCRCEPDEAQCPRPVERVDVPRRSAGRIVLANGSRRQAVSGRVPHRLRWLTSSAARPSLSGTYQWSGPAASCRG